MKNYELFDHTADIGVRVTGRDLPELFKNAALAMFDIIAEKNNPQPSREEKIKIIQKADSVDELFINWLNELLSLSATKELVFYDFQVQGLDEQNLKAVATGYPAINYRFNAEIKAATYHQLKLEQTKSGWQAEVVFDV